MKEATDKELLKIHSKGFSDYLDNKKPVKQSDELRQSAYDFGRADAQAGDDVSSVDQESNAYKIHKIRRSIPRRTKDGKPNPFGNDEVTLMKTEALEMRFIGVVSIAMGYSNKQVATGKAVFKEIGELTYKEFRNIKKLLK